MAFSWLKLTLACSICVKCAIRGAGAAAVKIVKLLELLFNIPSPVTICNRLLRSKRFFFTVMLFKFTKTPAKWSQHANTTYRNVVGCNMLHAFGHHVATCWVLLAQIWPVSNLSQQHPTCCNISQQGGWKLFRATLKLSIASTFLINASIRTVASTSLHNQLRFCLFGHCWTLTKK